MALLDELRQASEVAREKEQLEKESAHRLREIYDKEVNPRIERIYNYLKELELHLNYLKPDIRVDYNISGYGTLADLRQTGYHMEKGRKEVLKKVQFSFRCESGEELTFSVEGKKKLHAIMEEMDRAGIRYGCKRDRGGNNEVIGADITVEAVVPVSFEFKGELETSAIVMTIRNYEDLLWQQSYLNPQQVDDTFLDELGKYIVRKENDFLKIDLPNVEKAYFQRLVREARIERQKELFLADEREKDELEMNKKNSLVARLKSVKNPFAR